MPKIVSLDEIITDFGKNLPDESELELLLNSGKDEQRIIAILLKAGIALKREGRDAALKILSSAHSILGYIPLVIIGNLIELALKEKAYALASEQSFLFALNASQEGYDDLALEAASAAIILDSQSDFRIIRNPEKSLVIAQLYETAAKRNSLPQKNRVEKSREEKIKLALIIPNLVDNVIGYVKTALQIAKFIDKDRFKLSIFVSENLSQRDVWLFPFGCRQRKSEEAGKATIEEFKNYDVDVSIIPRSRLFISTAQYIAELIEKEKFDALILQTGLACPIDWLCGYWIKTPIKIALHNGSSLFLPGLTASFYDNPTNLERENSVWRQEFGERIIARQGTDIDEISLAPSLDRKLFAIPTDAILIGTMSNHLEHRLSSAYMEIICDVLKKYPKVFFIAFGGEKPCSALKICQEHNVADRFIYAGKQRNAAAALKMLDIYACEFPVGGSQSVVEAIACGLPVVALRWSNAHAESAAAEIIGKEFAINERDPEQYKGRLEELIEDADKRKHIGTLMRKRAEELYSVKKYVNVLSEYIIRKMEELKR